MAEKADKLDNEVNSDHITLINVDSKTVFEECEKGNLGHVFHFLHVPGRGINIQHEWSRDTLLHVCARNGHDSITTKILEHPDVNFEYLNKRNLSGDSCLHVAAQFGNHKILAEILAHKSCTDLINKPSLYTSDIPLHLAVRYGHMKCVEVLLKNNSDVFILNNENLIPLEFSKSSAHRVDILDMFLRFSSHAFSRGYSLSETLICYSINGVDANTLSRLLKKHPPGGERFLNAVVGLHLAIEHKDFEITNYLLKCGASVNEKTVENFTSLHAAAKSNSKEMFELIFPHCDDVNLVSKQGTALHIAAEKGCKAIAELLINAGSDLEIESSVFNETALHKAAKGNSVECVTLLTRNGADNMKKTFHDKTALGILFAINRETVIDWLSNSLDLFRFHSFRRAAIELMHRSNIHSRVFEDFDGVTSTENLESFIKNHTEDFVLFLCVLAKAKCFTTSARLVRFWRRHSFDPDLFTLTRKTEGLLAQAIRMPDFQLIHFLLAFPNFITYTSSPGALNEGEKALHAAVEIGRLELAKVLLEAGIKPTDLPGTYLANQNCNSVNRYLIETVEIPVDQTLSPYTIPLIQYALVHLNFEMAACLMQKGASLNVKDEFGFTPLHDAVWGRDVLTAEVMCTLQNINAQVSIPLDDVYSLDGSTPLHLASRGMHPKMVCSLLKEGASVKIYDNYGRLPLDLAFIQKEFTIIASLISAGADIRDVSKPELGHEPEDDDRLVLEVLKRCGYNKFQTVLDEEDPENEEFLKSDPMTLQDICGAVIRRSLKPNAWIGVEHLPLPKLLKEFLTLDLKDNDYGDYDMFDNHYDFPISCRLDCHNADNSDDDLTDDPILEMPYDP